ncbi:hypothetical protein [Allosalinactinospora lopnorensis]|uniref:hypothetical protein n=1 Tax=Allosalinactinospora lopnorensis TaxID=1352348 RepID=UPI000695DA4A|nr:hypothetical protein [Allosalinactinospora lopnorensis]
MPKNLIMPLGYLFDEQPADSGAHSTVRDLIAVAPRNPLGIQAGQIVAFTEEAEAAFDRALLYGSLRWSEQLDVVTMLYVEPGVRRAGIATALWQTAKEIHRHRTGRELGIGSGRTVLGELWMQRLGIAAPLSRLMLPMTLEQDTLDIDQRQLIPDDRAATIHEIACRYAVPTTHIDICCEPSIQAAQRRTEERR